jgi:hypothetical protein
MHYPLGLVKAMEDTIAEEARVRRREEAKARARGR